MVATVYRNEHFIATTAWSRDVNSYGTECKGPLPAIAFDTSGSISSDVVDNNYIEWILFWLDSLLIRIRLINQSYWLSKFFSFRLLSHCHLCKAKLSMIVITDKRFGRCMSEHFLLPLSFWILEWQALYNISIKKLSDIRNVNTNGNELNIRFVCCYICVSNGIWVQTSGRTLTMKHILVLILILIGGG